MRAGAWLAGAAVTVLLLTGCNDDGEQDSGADDAPSSVQPDASAVAPSESAAEAEVKPCDLLAPEDLSAAYARTMARTGGGGGGADYNGVQWQYDTCTWTEEEGLEVGLEVSDAADFADGLLVCPERDFLGEPATPVEGLAAPATWLRTSTSRIEARLQICTASHVLALEVESPSGTEADLATLKEQTLALAAVLLERAPA